MDQFIFALDITSALIVFISLTWVLFKFSTSKKNFKGKSWFFVLLFMFFLILAANFVENTWSSSLAGKLEDILINIFLVASILLILERYINNEFGKRKESEEKYRAILESIGEAVITTDIQGRIISMNLAAEELTNWKFEEVKNKSIDSTFQITKNENKKSQNELELITKDKIKKHIIKNSSFINHKNDSPQGIVHVLKDISKEYEINEELKTNRNRLSQALNGTNAGLWDWNLKNDEVFYNERWAEIAGYKLHELHPLNIKTWELLYHPHDIKKCKKKLEEYFKGNTEMYECESRLKHKNGNWIWALDRGKISEWDKNGQPLRMTGTHLDITKTKEAEFKLQDTLYWLKEAQKVSKSGYYQFNITQMSFETSSLLDDIFGIDKDFPKNFDNWIRLIHPNYRNEIEKYFINEILGKKRPFDKRYKIKAHNTGKEKWLHGYGKLILDETGKPIKMIGTIKDITETHEAEEKIQAQIQQYQKLNNEYLIQNEALQSSLSKIKKINEELIIARKKAEESDKLKSSFLANMSHEIRTPMNGILGFAALLEDPNLSHKTQKQYLSIIQQSGERMLSIINDLISISKIESGQTEMNKKEVNAYSILNNLYQFFQQEADAKNLKLSMSKNLDKESNLIADPTKLSQIITNLIKNAVRYTDKGYIHLGFTLIKNNSLIKFYVEDSGIGVSPEESELIFERFRQVGESQFSHEGAGLGLSISKAYVELHGGEIGVESQKGKGSTFWFTIPVNSPMSHND